MSKTGSVSNIVKKLSAMTTNKTRKAIAEYNNILKTIHIVKTINSLKYRQNIQIALNRGESCHQLAGNVSYAHGGNITAKTEREQLIFKECSRLVCNVIIYYNSQILSSFYLEKQKLSQNTFTCCKRYYWNSNLYA
jgi:TnpA family transposase